MKPRGIVGDRRPDKNPTERAFGAYLDLQLRAGEILDWGYEEMRFAVGSTMSAKTGKASTMWFTPDFWSQLPDGLIVIHETKGHMREAARVRLGAFRDRYRFPVYLVTGNGGRDGLQWTIREF
jgi:hypothetical protein